MSMREAQDRRRILLGAALVGAALVAPGGQARTETKNGAGAAAEAAGAATTLSQSEFDAMIARLRDLWLIPHALEHPEELRVTIRIRLGRDRRLAAPPVVVKRGRTARAQAVADAVIRAVVSGQPYDMLRDETYEAWKEMEIDFDPETMFRR